MLPGIDLNRPSTRPSRSETVYCSASSVGHGPISKSLFESPYWNKLSRPPRGTASLLCNFESYNLEFANFIMKNRSMIEQKFNHLI